MIHRIVAHYRLEPFCIKLLALILWSEGICTESYELMRIHSMSIIPFALNRLAGKPINYRVVRAKRFYSRYEHVKTDAFITLNQ